MRKLLPVLLVVLLLHTCAQATHFQRDLLYYNARKQKGYEWNVIHALDLGPDSEEAICFGKSATSCVKYSFTSSKPILAFVTEREHTNFVLQGQRAVPFELGSECVGLNCGNISVEVSTAHSYCLVMVNRVQDVPYFDYPSNQTAQLAFQVGGCPPAIWTLIYVVIGIIMVVGISGCCVAVCVHHFRKRNLHNAPVVQMQMTALAVPYRGPAATAGQDIICQPPVSQPARPIQMFEAKI